MSSETLSQQEIDALFSGGPAAAEPVEAAPAAVRERIDDIQVYDFRRPNLISKDRLRALDAMYSLMCKSLEAWLTARVRGQVELQLVGVEHFNYGEFVLSLPSPCSSFVFDIGEAGGQQGLVDFGRDFAFYLVDRLLGGGSTPIVQERVLTPLERMVVRIGADQVATQLNAIWKEHVNLGLTLSRFESMPEMLRIANREDPMLVANVLVRMGDVESPLVVCLPLAVLEKFFIGSGPQRVKATRGTSREREADRIAVEQTVRSSAATLSARFPQFALTMHELAYIQPGQTMMTGLPHDAGLTLFVGHQARFAGLPGRSGSRLAVRIRDVLDSTLSNGVVTPPTRPTIMTTTTYEANAAAAEQASAAGVKLTELEATSSGGAGSALSSLFKLTLPVTIELGRAQMTVQEVLDLTRGSVVQLDRLVGEPVDVLVGDRRFAEGEVVVIGEQFGVRITRIISAQAALEGGQ